MVSDACRRSLLEILPYDPEFDDPSESSPYEFSRKREVFDEKFKRD